jgi:DNA-binding response OmpR family regulator
VLVVEDDAALRTFYRSSLMLAGFDVITAENGVDALHRIEGDQPSLVVLDLGLPLLSGRDVRRELAAHLATKDIPVVVVTGDPDDLDPTEFPCVLRKPVTPESLIEAVENCLRSK